MQPEAFDRVPGQGAKGIVAGQEVALGNATLMRALGLDPQPHEAALAKLRADGKSALLVAVGGRIAGLLAVADPIKASDAGGAGALRARGIDVIMATGDDRVTAEAVARKLGIRTVHAGMLPADKAQLVADLKAQGRRVAMAGDGVNDAPALAAADVGIAMGTGADVAIESAGITLPKGDLMGLVARPAPGARRRSPTSARTWRSLSATTRSAFRSRPACSIRCSAVLLSPMLAAAAMSLSSVSVIANALRLARLKLDR